MMQLDDLAHEQRKLEDEIAFLEQKLRQLRNKSNNQIPIARLPPEILSEIFLNQAAKIREERLTIRRDDDCPDDLVHKSFYTWLNVSHVSRHWREVSLNCVQLWTWLALEPRITDGIVETLLSRARDLPLTAVLLFFSTKSYCGGCVRLDLLLDHYRTTLYRLETLLPRLRELVVVVDWEDCEELWDVLAIPTDTLETIRIEGVGTPRFSPPLVIPSQLFASRTPRLHSVKLASVDVDWPNTLLCSSLRHLDVSRCGMDGDGELQPFLSAICTLPHLETLRAHWTRPSTSTIPETRALPEEHEIAPVPRLKQVHLSGGNQRIATIILYTCWPVETRMHFTIIDTVAPAEREYFQLAFRTLFSKETVRGSMYAFNSFGVDTSLLLWSVAGKITAKDPAATELRVEEPLNLDLEEIPPPRLHIRCDTDSFEHPISIALQAVDLAHLHVLLVLGTTTGRQWASMFRSASRLAALRVKGQAAFALPALLTGDVCTLSPQDVSLAVRAGLDEWHWLEFNRGGGEIVTQDVDNTQAREDLVLTAHAAEVLNGAEIADPSPSASSVNGQESGAEEGRRGDDNSDKVPRVLFPNLRVVQVAAVDIALPDGWAGPLPFKHPAVMDLMMYRAKHAKYGLDVAALARCLRMRREQGVGEVSALEFCGCHCEDKAQLQPLVEQGMNVSWDGQSVLLSDS